MARRAHVLSISSALLVPVALFSIACGPVRLAKQPTPGKQTITAEPPSPAPRPGHGRLYVDTVGGPARVGKITKIVETQIAVPNYSMMTLTNGVMIPVVSGTRSVAAKRREVRPLCATPCVVDLPIGDHLVELRRDRNHVDIVNLRITGNARNAYRHALGRNDVPNLRRAFPAILLLSVGISAMITSPLAYLGDKRLGAGLAISGALITILTWPWFQRVRPRAQKGSGYLWTF